MFSEAERLRPAKRLRTNDYAGGYESVSSSDEEPNKTGYPSALQHTRQYREQETRNLIETARLEMESLVETKIQKHPLRPFANAVLGHQIVSSKVGSQTGFDTSDLEKAIQRVLHAYRVLREADTRQEELEHEREIRSNRLDKQESERSRQADTVSETRKRIESFLALDVVKYGEEMVVRAKEAAKVLHALRKVYRGKVPDSSTLMTFEVLYQAITQRHDARITGYLDTTAEEYYAARGIEADAQRYRLSLGDERVYLMHALVILDSVLLSMLPLGYVVHYQEVSETQESMQTLNTDLGAFAVLFESFADLSDISEESRDMLRTTAWLEYLLQTPMWQFKTPALLKVLSYSGLVPEVQIKRRTETKIKEEPSLSKAHMAVRSTALRVIRSGDKKRSRDVSKHALVASLYNPIIERGIFGILDAWIIAFARVLGLSQEQARDRVLSRILDVFQSYTAALIAGGTTIYERLLKRHTEFFLRPSVSMIAINWTDPSLVDRNPYPYPLLEAAVGVLKNENLKAPLKNPTPRLGVDVLSKAQNLPKVLGFDERLDVSIQWKTPQIAAQELQRAIQEDVRVNQVDHQVLVDRAAQLAEETTGIKRSELFPAYIIEFVPLVVNGQVERDLRDEQRTLSSLRNFDGDDTFVPSTEIEKITDLVHEGADEVEMLRQSLRNRRSELREHLERELPLDRILQSAVDYAFAFVTNSVPSMANLKSPRELMLAQPAEVRSAFAGVVAFVIRQETILQGATGEYTNIPHYQRVQIRRLDYLANLSIFTPGGFVRPALGRMGGRSFRKSVY